MNIEIKLTIWAVGGLVCYGILAEKATVPKAYEPPHKALPDLVFRLFPTVWFMLLIVLLG